MKISKGTIITIIFALSMILVAVCAIADGNLNPYSNTTKYLKDAFNENEYGVQIIDSNNGEDVTDSFILKNKELYESSDWDAIMENFLSENYHLQVERNPDED